MRPTHADHLCSEHLINTPRRELWSPATPPWHKSVKHKKQAGFQAFKKPGAAYAGELFLASPKIPLLFYGIISHNFRIFVWF
jgi:hypothetical protein